MNIYVGNLSYGVSEDNLREVFEAYGEVSSCKVITDKYSGRSKGFGFVEMDNDSEAQAAIDQLDG
ncbi:MAG TPA: RNA-binding protein, partial [Balneola sp.]|nr:RNA-binding protein [Balneola sp.]